MPAADMILPSSIIAKELGLKPTEDPFELAELIKERLESNGPLKAMLTEIIESLPSVDVDVAVKIEVPISSDCLVGIGNSYRLDSNYSSYSVDDLGAAYTDNRDVVTRLLDYHEIQTEDQYYGYYTGGFYPAAILSRYDDGTLHAIDVAFVEVGNDNAFFVAKGEVKFTSVQFPVIACPKGNNASEKALVIWLAKNGNCYSDSNSAVANSRFKVSNGARFTVDRSDFTSPLSSYIDSYFDYDFFIPYSEVKSCAFNDGYHYPNAVFVIR